MKSYQTLTCLCRVPFWSDIDECRYGYCQQLCANVPGSYSCSCNPGFILNPDSRTCQGAHTHTGTSLLFQPSLCPSVLFNYLFPVVGPDVNECDEEPCTHGCFNTYGSFMCNCDEGFELAADGTSCIGEASCSRLLFLFLTVSFNLVLRQGNLFMC